MNASVTGAIGRAITDYAGRIMLGLDVYPDPNVPGVFAVRASFRKRHGKAFVLDFLIRVPLKNVTADDLEECEFTCWPPEVMR